MTVNGNVTRFLQRHALEQPSRVALKFEDRNYTYAEAEAETDRLARAFRDLGVRQGDAVCLIMPNCPEFVFTWFALARLGAITVPVNGEFTENRLARLINTVSAEIVVLDSRYDHTLAGALDQVSRVHTIIRRGPHSELAPASDRMIAFDEVQPVAPDPAPVAIVAPHDPFMLVFTSGSTGEAKAVEISHGYAEHWAVELTCHLDYRSDDVFFTCFPLFYSEATLMTVTPAMILGATAAVVERFSASRFWEQIRKMEATHFCAMGAVHWILLQQPPSERDRDHRVRVTNSGAVHERVREFEDRFGVRMVQEYGGTEYCLVAFHDDRPEPGIMGRPCEHHEILVVDDNDLPVPVGEVGEILVRPRVPHGCMSGYYRDGAETARAWRNLWYHTGDLGYADDTGLLRFAGRVKDVIRRRGRNIPPAEIETVLRDHPDISDCVAIAVPSELIEEDVKIVVEPRHGTTPNLDDIIRTARQRLPRYMQPRYLELVTEIPRLPSQKPDKAMLRKNWNTPATIDIDQPQQSYGARTQQPATP